MCDLEQFIIDVIFIVIMRRNQFSGFKKELEAEIRSETSGFYRRVLVALSAGNRDELSDQDKNELFRNGPGRIIDRERAVRDANELYEAGEKSVSQCSAPFSAVL